jgi:hypothetical protein
MKGTGILLASAAAMAFAGAALAADTRDGTEATGAQIHGSGAAESGPKDSTDRGSESDRVGSAGTRRRGDPGMENKGGVRGGSGATGSETGGRGNEGAGDRKTDAMGDHDMGDGSGSNR